MKAERDPKTGKWLIQYRYKDWTGKNRKSTKRGFKTKREAEEWLRAFLLKQTRSFDMKFSDFVIIYMDDMKNRLREHTLINKRYANRELVQKMCEKLGEKFASEKHAGPADVAAFLGIEDREEQERIKQDAYQKVRFLVDKLTV